MKKKLSYKSKRTLIIVITIVALFAIAAIGIVAYIKGNESARAVVTENEGSTNENAENNSENISEVVEQNDTNQENEEISNEDESIEEETVESDETGTNTENDDTNGPTTNNGTTQNNANVANDETEDVAEGTTTTTDSEEDVPNTEYTQTGEEVEKKVSDSFYVSWTPIAVNAITEQISEPKMEIHKKSFVNNETENDQEIHTAVVENDYITYTISVKNNGDFDMKNVHIYDTVPEGTEFVEAFDDGEINKDRLTWIKDIKAGEEITVSFKVKVLIEKDEEGNTITQIDNTAIVNGEETETTHNPIILPEKEVKAIAENEDGELKELDNQVVIPGSRLRYYITLTNNSKYDGTTKVTDQVPEGTTLIDGTISEGGEIDENNVITWNNINVQAGTTTKVYFDVIVNNDMRETVSNVAKIGTNEETPYETNTVETPVVIARKTSALYDGKTVTEQTEVTYLVEIVATNVSKENSKNVKTATVKLVDEFWMGDELKVSFVEGSIKVNGKETNNKEDFLRNIEVELNAGEKISIEYKYVLKNLPTSIEKIEVRNNLYWAKPTENDPSRPNNKNDETKYENPNPDTENQFQNEELKDYIDPTEPTVDQNQIDELKKQEKEDNEKDLTKPIDTVIVNVNVIKGEKKVNVIDSQDGKLVELDNQAVIPGSRLRYTITLTNNTNVAGKVNITDTIPTGTTLVVGTITDGGKATGNIITWSDIEVEAKGTKEVSFDVTVNEDRDKTVKNVAKYGSDSEPENQRETNEVQTPVITASKTSKYEGKILEAGDEVTYVVEIKATDVDDEYKDTVVETTVNLLDKFNKEDDEKVEFVSGNIKINGKTYKENATKADIENISVPLNPGDKVKIEYVFKIKDYLKGNVYTDTIENNLYWADEPDEPIDEVDIEVIKYIDIPVTKEWKDDDEVEDKRPSEITVKLYGRDEDKAIETATLTASDNWKYKFENLPAADKDGKITYTIEEVQIDDYESKVTGDNSGFTITNTWKPDVTGTITMTNVTDQTAPMDVMFVLDISSSMLCKGTSSSMNFDDNKAIDMVKAVNAAITELMKNQYNRVGIELFNSGTTDLLELGYYTPKTKGEYIQYSTYTDTENNIQRGKISLNVNEKSETSGTLYNNHYSSDNYYVGTYTQGGINEARKMMTSNSNNTTVTIDGEQVDRVPVMILLTDGDPTHYDTNYEDPMTPDITNKIYAPTAHDEETGLGGVGILRFNTSEYYKYTMKTIVSAKQKIAEKYGQQCNFYTIGMYMSGSMAAALLDPYNSETGTDNISRLNTVTNDINGDIHGGYSNGTPAGNQYYINQQKNLYTAIKDIEDYTDASFTNNMTEENMKTAFSKIIQLSSQSESDITALQSKERKINLSDIDESGKFIIKVNGTDRNGKTISINETFDTFTDAKNNFNSETGTVYINGTTIDFTNLKSGSVEITYKKK